MTEMSSGTVEPGSCPPLLKSVPFWNLRLPEVVVAAFPIIAGSISAALDPNPRNPGAGFVLFILGIPAFVLLIAGLLAGIALQRRPVTDFRWDAGFVAAGAFSAWLAWLTGGGVLWVFACLAVIGLSAALRRAIALTLWRRGRRHKA